MAQTEGAFWIDKKGERVHPDIIPADKKLEDELVTQMVADAAELQAQIANFREGAFERVESFMALLMQHYNIDRARNTTKGNISLWDFSGLNRVDVAVATLIRFDTKLKMAKLKIDEYLQEVTQGAAPELQTLILKAFEVDKKGDVDAKKVLALRSYDIPHPTWREAIQIISEAAEVVGTNRYIRFYRRKSREDAWEHVVLELAGAKKAEEKGESNAAA